MIGRFPHNNLASSKSRCAGHGGFTLIETLAVLAIIGVLTTLAVAAFNALGDAQGFDSQVSDFQQLLDDARAYAMGNNAYVFVGVEEVDASKPTTAVPQTLVTGTTSGNGGRIAVAVVTTKDGTGNLGTNNSNVTAINKLKVFPNLHMLTTYYQNAIATATATSPSPLANRATVSNKKMCLGFNPTTAASGNLAEYFTWPLSGTTQYSFNHFIQYAPDGTATMIAPSSYTQTTYTPTWMEIDLEEMHGYALSALPAYSSLNSAIPGHQVAAIQVDGITGNSSLYRQ